MVHSKPKRSVVFDVDNAGNKDFKSKVLRELKRHSVKIATCLEPEVGLVVSDHPSAKEIRKRGRQNLNSQLLRRIPLNLREAVLNNILVEPFESFRNNLSDWIPRLSPHQIQQQELDRRLSVAPRKQPQDEDLGEFFFKYHHIHTSYRPEGVRLDNSPVISFAEDRHLVERRADKKRKRKVDAGSDDVMIIGSDNESGGRRYSERECKKNTKYCYRCEMVVDNMEMHLGDEIHAATINAPGYFQKIDALGKGMGLEDFIAREAAKDAAKAAEKIEKKAIKVEEPTVQAEEDENTALAPEEMETAEAESKEEASLENIVFVSTPEMNSEGTSSSISNPIQDDPEVTNRANEIAADPMIPHRQIQGKACEILMQKEELKFLEELTRHLMKKQICDDTIIPAYNEFLRDNNKTNLFIESKGAYRGLMAMLQSHIDGATSSSCENQIAQDKLQVAKTLLIQLRAWWKRYKRLYQECLLFKDYKKPRQPSTNPPKNRNRT